jgi:hypothetical protein
MEFQRQIGMRWQRAEKGKADELEKERDDETKTAVINLLLTTTHGVNVVWLMEL